MEKANAICNEMDRICNIIRVKTSRLPFGSSMTRNFVNHLK
ncbi:hypothetical protein WwAna1812, partial [Wolbachia endosymbiont of Drosophila ananassae]